MAQEIKVAVLEERLEQERTAKETTTKEVIELRQ